MADQRTVEVKPPSQTPPPTYSRDQILWVSNIDDNRPSSYELMGASKLIGKYCMAENLQFYACKSQNKNPELCIQEGYRVSLCVNKLYELIKNILYFKTELELIYIYLKKKK